MKTGTQRLVNQSRRFFSRGKANSSTLLAQSHRLVEVSDEKETKIHDLEKITPTKTSAVEMRRQFIRRNHGVVVSEKIPFRTSQLDTESFFDQVHKTNCENVIGYIPIPVGVAGPLKVNDKSYIVPMATTEGALIASTNRGISVINRSGGCYASVYRDGMTRAPVVELPSIKEAVDFVEYLNDHNTFLKMKAEFENSTRFGRLCSVESTLAGRFVYIRFAATTGEAMGMNMVTKGVHRVVFNRELFTNKGRFEPRLIALSSNLCTDKKSSAVNWINGRGKSVVCEATVPEEILKSCLKVDVEQMVQLNIAKNLIGSSLAGGIGGNNAHTSNIVTAIFIATGQDVAQNVESSNCLLQMSSVPEGLNISVTMPSIEVGIVGGGTALEAQRGSIEMLGITSAQELAKVVAATTLAGELSLNAALASDQLVSAHMKLNRK